MPLAGVGAQYFELFDLSNLKQAMTTLLAVPAAVAVATMEAGGFLGPWASRRVLHPVTEVAGAAATIAAGRLDTRLPLNSDLNELAASFHAICGPLSDRIQRDARFGLEVSHELRSPAITLAAAGEALQHHRRDLDPRARQALDLLPGDVHRFRRLVSDLLETSHADTGRTRTGEETATVTELVVQPLDANGQGEVSLEIDARSATAVIQVERRTHRRSAVCCCRFRARF